MCVRIPTIFSHYLCRRASGFCTQGRQGGYFHCKKPHLVLIALSHSLYLSCPTYRTNLISLASEANNLVCAVQVLHVWILITEMHIVHLFTATPSPTPTPPPTPPISATPKGVALIDALLCYCFVVFQKQIAQYFS